MIGDNFFFTNMFNVNEGFVTFGEGSKAKICDKGMIRAF